GASDFYNTPNVLPMMDNLYPHLAGNVMTYSFQLTLPNVECDNCTLQVIQVMEDNLAHGDYDPTPGVGIADIYHQCIDLVLKRGANTSGDGGTGTGGTGGAGGNAGGAGGGGTGGGSSSGGGCAFAAGTRAGMGGLFVAALVACAIALRRKRC